MAFSGESAEFKKRNCEVVACSTDSKFSHKAWMEVDPKKGGIKGVEIPILADFRKEASQAYGVLKEDLGAALRGLFLIDPDGVLQYQVVQQLAIGRNPSEVLRVLDALQYNKEHGEVCPANWAKGKKAIDTKKPMEFFEKQA